ncbi:MAG: hypothetical protein ACREL7_15680 [Longimicrobiales bacterium]
MTYERWTALPIGAALRLAEQILTDRLPIEKTGGDGHSVRLTGGDGTVVVSAHKHGFETVVVAETDQVRTSRLDGEVQYYLTMLPFQPGDTRMRGEDQPGGLSGYAT